MTENNDMNTRRSRDDELAVVRSVVNEEVARHDGMGCEFIDNLVRPPWSTYKLVIPVFNGAETARRICNGIFHRLGFISEGEYLGIGDASRYCQIERHGDYYYALFNEPLATREDYMSPGMVLQNYREHGTFVNDRAEFEHSLGHWDFDDIEHKETMSEILADIKAGRLKARSREDVRILLNERFDEFALGKRSDLRYGFSLYDIKCAIGIESVLLKRGYGKPGFPPKQLRFDVTDIRLVDEDGNECDPYNVPTNFWPTEIAVFIKRRPEDDDRCKFLMFSSYDSPDTLPFRGCVGSLGTLRKLCYNGNSTDDGDIRFLIYTDDGVFGISTRAGGEPGFHVMRFLSVWREDTSCRDEHWVPGEYRALLFNPQIVASIEKAGLSFQNHSRIGQYKAGDEIELLDPSSALMYLKTSTDFSNVDLYWPFGVLEKILWCDKNWRPLCERGAGFHMMAEFDSNLLSIFPPTRGTDELDHSHRQQLLAMRYHVYALVRNGVFQKWENWW